MANEEDVRGKLKVSTSGSWTAENLGKLNKYETAIFLIMEFISVFQYFSILVKR